MMKFPWPKLIPNARPGLGRFDLGHLKEIHLAGFSLGWAAYTGQVEKLTSDEILAAEPHREWMLVLARS